MNLPAANDDSRRVHQRVQLSCDPCRASKLKCDRTLPICEQCHKRSRDSACVFTKKGFKHISDTQRAKSMKDKLQRLEELVNYLQANPAYEATVKQTNEAQDKYELSAKLETIRFEGNGSTEWIGPSDWKSVVKDFADIRAYLEHEEDDETSESLTNGQPSNDLPVVDVLLGTTRFFSREELIKRLPCRADMDRFTASWLNLLDFTRIIVHGPTFQRQYYYFWQNPQQVHPAWFALLLSMSSLGAECSSRSLGDVHMQNQAELLRRMAAIAFNLAGHTKPQPWLVEAMLLYIVGLLFKHHDITTEVWHLLGMVIRLCHSAGYHRDPGDNPQFTRFDCEMRRRIWMVAYHLDVAVSSTLGLVSWVNEAICNTRAPSNLTDSDFGPDFCSPPRPWEDCTMVQVEICCFAFTPVLVDIMICSHATDPPTKAKVQELNHRLDQAREQLPRKLRMLPLEQCCLDSPLELVDRYRLEFIYLKGLCILYRRFLGESQFAHERQKCIRASLVVVQHSIKMLESAEPNGQLASSRMLLMRYVHIFALAAMLLCSELKRLDGQHEASGYSEVDDTTALTLMRACKLWNTNELPSLTARKALGAITKFLEMRRLNIVSEQFPVQTPLDSLGVATNMTTTSMTGTPMSTSYMTTPSFAQQYVTATATITPGGNHAVFTDAAFDFTCGLENCYAWLTGADQGEETFKNNINYIPYSTEAWSGKL